MANWGVGFGEFAGGLAEGVTAGMKLGAQYQYTRRQRMAADTEERREEARAELEAVNKEERKEALTPEEKQRVWAYDARTSGRVAKGGTDPLGLVESGSWLSGLGRAFKRLWGSIDTSGAPGAQGGVPDATAYTPTGYRPLTQSEREGYGDYGVRRADGGVIPDPSELHIKLPPDQEQIFQKWYGGWAERAGINPNPDDPGHKYDYRAAWRAGAKPSVDPNDGLYHWPSQFKDADHPNRYVGGVDTRAGGRPGSQEFGIRDPQQEVGEGVSRSAFGYRPQPGPAPAPAVAPPVAPRPDPTQPSPQATAIADGAIRKAGGKSVPAVPPGPVAGSREQVPGGFYDPGMVYPNLTPPDRTMVTLGGKQAAQPPGPTSSREQVPGGYYEPGMVYPNLTRSDVTGRQPGEDPTEYRADPTAGERRGLPEPDASYPGHPRPGDVTASQPGGDPNFPSAGSYGRPGEPVRVPAPSDVTAPQSYRPDAPRSTYGTLLGDSDEPAGLPPGFRSPRATPSASTPQGEQGTVRGDMTLSMPGVRQQYDPTDVQGGSGRPPSGFNPGAPPPGPQVPLPPPPEREAVAPPPLKPIAVPPRGSMFYGTDPKTGDSLYIVPGFGNTPTPWPPIPGQDAAPPGTPGAGPGNVPGGPMKPGGDNVVKFKPQGAPGAIRTPEDQSADAKVIPLLARSPSPPGQQPKDFIDATKPPGSPDGTMPDPQRYTQFLRYAQRMMEVDPEHGMRMLGLLMDTQMKGLQHGLVGVQIAMEAGDFDRAQQLLMRTYNGFISPATGDYAQFNIDKQGNITMQRHHLDATGKLVAVDKKPQAVSKDQLVKMGVISMGPGHLADYILKQQQLAETQRHHGAVEAQGRERLQREDVRFGVQLQMDNNRLKLQIWEAERKERRDAQQAYREGVKDYLSVQNSRLDIAEKLRKLDKEAEDAFFNDKPVSAKEGREFLDATSSIFDSMVTDKKSGLFDPKTIPGRTEGYSPVEKQAIQSLAAQLYPYNTKATPEELLRLAADMLYNKDFPGMLASGRPGYRYGYSTSDPNKPYRIPEFVARQVQEGGHRRAVEGERQRIIREVGKKDTPETGGGRPGELPTRITPPPTTLEEERRRVAEGEEKRRRAEAVDTEVRGRQLAEDKAVGDRLNAIPSSVWRSIVEERQDDAWLQIGAKDIAKQYNIPEDRAYTRLRAELDRYRTRRRGGR